MIRPGSLKPGDRIGIVSTARKTGSDALEYALSAIRRWEFVPVAGEHLLSSCNQFAGTDSERAADFQRMLDDPGISAILCARGGYGTARIIDRIDFTEFIRNPKWIIGYSDATVLHSHIQENFGIATLHASMPVNFKSNTTEALNGIKGVLEGALPSYAIGGHPLNRKGNASGILTGGNLSILYGLPGSPSDCSTNGKILFIEDLDEYLYHIDRMMVSLKRAEKLSRLSGLIVGGMTDMHDNEIAFGKTAEEIVRDAAEEYAFPICFGFPAGHIDDNRPLVLGCKVVLSVQDEVTVTFC